MKLGVIILPVIAVMLGACSQTSVGTANDSTVTGGSVTTTVSPNVTLEKPSKP
jgi:hypothetical protein